LIIILCGSLFSVKVDVLINKWNGQFMTLIAKATTEGSQVTQHELFSVMFDFAKVAGLSVVVSVILSFFTSHWIFRWRTALTDSYVAGWERLRHIEGASQRIQEDTMRFASIMESLGESLLNSVLTLLAFLPLLAELSQNVTSLPLLGEVPYALVWAAVLWSIAGTALLALVGWKLPGLEFQNQLVEAAYRKELVLGEDDASHASEPVCKSLFAAVKKNYSVLFFHFTYFNVARNSYLQFDVIFPYLLLVPSLSAGSLTMGQITQVASAFGSVSRSFQYLVLSWKTIVDLLSIFKRLRAFETGAISKCKGATETKEASEDGCSLDDVESKTSSTVDLSAKFR